MFKKFAYAFTVSAGLCLGLAGMALAASQNAAAPAGGIQNQAMTLWQLIEAGGLVMIFLGLISVAALALIIYHFRFVTVDRLVPRDFTENILSLLEKKEFEKARSVCQQQENMISAITLKGLEKLPKGKSVVEEAVQAEGKSRIERIWQNLSYLGDMAVVAQMLGLLGTILGMIDAFNFQAFKAGIIKPVILAQGLAKAMITTAFGLIIAVPVLILYSYFRGRISTITSSAERVASEITHNLTR